MSDLPEIGDDVMREEFCDRQGATLQLSGKKCTKGSCVFVKSSDVGQRITHFRRDFVRHDGD